MLRDLAKAVIPANARYLLRAQATQARQRGVGWTWQWNRILIDAYVRERLNRHRYHELDEAALRARRTSDTVFIFGSGYSLNELSETEWRHFAAHDVFGFNMFIYERWVPIRFQLLRGGAEGQLAWRSYGEHIAETIRDNPHCRDTVFLLQGEYQAQFCNQMIGYRLLPVGQPIFRYHTARADGPPTRSFPEGLRHISGTLSDAVNAAVCLGWQNIVLVGIDLYDSRYFWLPATETTDINPDTGAISGEYNTIRGTRYDDTHNTVRIGIVDTMQAWTSVLRERGHRLSVYNPRSLLSSVMPVYNTPSLHPSS